jgi:sulfopyruvate decarboxylase alpha subunit
MGCSGEACNHTGPIVQGKISKSPSAGTIDWPAAIHRALKAQRVRQVSYVPDAGHKHLIDLCHADRGMAAVPLTTEEEGIGLAAGAWLGGERSALLMQSSGVGNCINALSLASTCGFPLLLLVTMRGETGERNPWQVPMGQATPEALRLAGVRTLRLGRAEEASAVANTAAKVAFEEQSAVALLISQQLIGVKSFEEKR